MKRSTSGIAIASFSLAVSFAVSTRLHAQDTAPVPQTVEQALHQMSDLAGIIFLGEVVAVRHPDLEHAATGITEVDFRIDQAVRGCTSGSTYTLREWAGLWQGGDERYRPGQRLLMMLHSPNAAGLSSPVGGMDGALPVGPASSAPLLASSATVSEDPPSASPTPASPSVDLRWIGTRVLRKVPYASSSLAVAQSVASATDTQLPAPAPQQAPVSAIVGMLSSWQQALP